LSGRLERRFPGFGQCIYCGSSSELRDEHVVPFGIGGRHVIEAASCAACEKITSNFERVVTRDIWGYSRLAANAPSRRPNRKKQIEVGRRRVPISEYPRNFLFLKMPECGLLQGFDANVDLSTHWLPSVISDDKRMNAFRRKYGSDFHFHYKHLPNSFGRFILQIAYCSVLTWVPMGKFIKIAPSFILDENSNSSFLVGMNINEPAKPENFGYWFSPFFVLLDGRGFIGARVRILANTEIPIYHAVVGEFFDRSVINLVLDAHDFGFSGKQYFAGFGKSGI